MLTSLKARTDSWHIELICDTLRVLIQTTNFDSAPPNLLEFWSPISSDLESIVTDAVLSPDCNTNTKSEHMKARNTAKFFSR